jgi:hypothetical protein
MNPDPNANASSQPRPKPSAQPQPKVGSLQPGTQQAADSIGLTQEIPAAPHTQNESTLQVATQTDESQVHHSQHSSLKSDTTTTTPAATTPSTGSGSGLGSGSNSDPSVRSLPSQATSEELASSQFSAGSGLSHESSHPSLCRAPRTQYL